MTHSQWSPSPGIALYRPEGPASLKVILFPGGQPESKDWSAEEGPTHLPQPGEMLNKSLILPISELESRGVREALGQKSKYLGSKLFFPISVSGLDKSHNLLDLSFKF